MLMAYEGGAVFLDFVTPQADCETVEKEVAAIGPPFTTSFTPVDHISFVTPVPACLKSDFAANGILIAKVLIVLVNGGENDPAAVSFCDAWMGGSVS